jgi:hypothetical protein
VQFFVKPFLYLFLVDQVLLYSFLPIIFSEMEKEGKSKRELKKKLYMKNNPMVLKLYVY